MLKKKCPRTGIVTEIVADNETIALWAKVKAGEKFKKWKKETEMKKGGLVGANL